MLSLRKFTETDYMAFAGVESDSPRIGEITVNKEEAVIILDGLRVEIICGDGETVIGRNFQTALDAELFINGLEKFLPLLTTYYCFLTFLGFKTLL